MPWAEHGGLTTAASIWAASAVGMTLLCTLSMSMLQRLEARPPGRSTLELCLTFSAAGRRASTSWPHGPSRAATALRDSLRISFTDSQPTWRFRVVAPDRPRRVAGFAGARDG